MIALSSQCLAIAMASRNGTLALVERSGRFGLFIAICDDRGTIEVCDDLQSANARVSAILERMA